MLRYFWRVLVWLILTHSPSQPNHTWLLWGSPCGPTVATWARALLPSRSSWLTGIRVLLSVRTHSFFLSWPLEVSVVADVMVSHRDEQMGFSRHQATGIR
jgi:hypothetical protein